MWAVGECTHMRSICMRGGYARPPLTQMELRACGTIPSPSLTQSTEPKRLGNSDKETSFLTRRKTDSCAHYLVGNELLKTEGKEQSVSECSTVLGLFSPSLDQWVSILDCCLTQPAAIAFRVGFCFKTFASDLGGEEEAISQECPGMSHSTPHLDSITTQESSENLWCH